MTPIATLGPRSFNPRTPCEVRPSICASIFRVFGFNPRTPCEVRHEDFRTIGDRLPVSIHAPPARCDHLGKGLRFICNCFNPRTPCEVRQYTRNFRNLGKWFQSTHPLRGATKTFTISTLSIMFQSTHPLRGATRKGQKLQKWLGRFNPRTPCEVRHNDNKAVQDELEFQSTHPLRGATIKPMYLAAAAAVSIHAPPARCDMS